MSTDCIFCKIIAGQVPCAKVYEDADTVAFMDIAPVMKGHTLVIPKTHHDPILNTPPEVLQKVIVSVRTVARAVAKALGADGLNVSQANGRCAGQIIPHIHFHIIPRYNHTPFNWTPGKYDSPQEMQDTAARIRAALE